MEQFTASEVRAEAHRHANEVEDMLNAFADLLEAQEKAVPVAWMHPDLHDGHPYPEDCLNQEKIEGWLPLYAHSAQAQPPAASVPDAETLRLHLGELTPDEVCVAKAAYRLALAAQENPNG